MPLSYDLAEGDDEFIHILTGVVEGEGVVHVVHADEACADANDGEGADGGAKWVSTALAVYLGARVLEFSTPFCGTNGEVCHALLVYCAILIGLVSARDEILLMVFDLDDVLPAAGETVGTGSLIENEDVEVTVYRPLGVQ